MADITSIVIPEGEVVKIAFNGVTLWESGSADYRDIYQRVEYIASSSDRTQYIKTDYIANDQTGLRLLHSVPSYGDVISAGSRATTTDTRFYTPYMYSATRQYGGWNTTRSTYASTTLDAVYDCRVNWKNSRSVDVYNMSGTRMSYVSFSSTQLKEQTTPIFLFCASSASSSSGRSSIRDMALYGAQISQGSSVVREYIPCYRKSDGVIGVYETYTGTFATNAGTGEFTKGSDMAWEE